MGSMKNIVVMARERTRQWDALPTSDGMDHRRRKIVPCIDEGYIGQNSVMHSRAEKSLVPSCWQNHFCNSIQKTVNVRWNWIKCNQLNYY